MSEVEEEDAAGSSAGRTIVGTVTGPMVVNPHEKESFLRRYKVALAVFVVFGVTLAFAAAYPKRDPIDRPPPITVSLSTGEPLHQAYLEIAALPNHSYQISIDVVTGSALSSTNGYASGNITLPSDAVVLPGCLARCVVHPSSWLRIPSHGGFLINDLHASWRQELRRTDYVTDPLYDDQSSRIRVGGERSERRNMDSRVHHHRALLVRDLTPPISVKYDIPDVAGYDWSGGPSSTGNYWMLMPNQVTSPIALTGTNSSGASRDSLLTFVSGIVLGIEWWRPRRSDPGDGTRRVRRTAEAAARRPEPMSPSVRVTL